MKKFLAYLRTDIFRRNLIIAIGFVVVLLLVVFFSLRMYTRHGETVAVPDLKGLHIDEATRVLKNQGFEYDLDSIYQVDAVPGLVIDQDPIVDTRVKKNRTIYLTIITRSAPEITFPELRELTLIEAESLLQSYGLKRGDTTYMPDIARDVVLDVHFGGAPLQAGTVIPKGSTIDLKLGDGRGGNQVAVPDLTGLTLMEARFALQGVALNLGQILYLGPVTDSLSATVVGQDPEGGPSLISIGSPIDLILAN
ncbi:MAG TPA: PASTA domain-containing protein [Sphingobacteriaceae bacterium]|nr:PASTA domain-containing protein [Sphingobacteriaceae bacterium]